MIMSNSEVTYDEVSNTFPPVEADFPCAGMTQKVFGLDLCIREKPGGDTTL